MFDAKRKPPSEDLRNSALNDIEHSVNDLLSNPLDEGKWNSFNSSLKSAQLVGVSAESVLSKLLNTLPDPLKDNVVRVVAKKHNLTDSQIESILAPED